MKHKTHRIVSVNILYFLLIISYFLNKFYNFNFENFIYYLIVTTFLTLKFSVLPDKVEGQDRKKHRTWAHSLNILTLIILILFIFRFLIISYLYKKNFSNFIIPIEITYTVLLNSIIIGWGSHLLLDFITDNGIPLLYPLNKERMQIYKFCTYKNDTNEQYLFSITNYTFLIQIIILLYVITK